MPRQSPDAARVGFPPQPPSEQSTPQSSLDLLHNWRTGCAATALVTAALLPLAIIWHASDLVAIATSMIVSVTIAAGCHVVREHRLAMLAIFPEFARLPELAGTRERLVRPRNRRRLAGQLRRTAAIRQPPNRFNCCPVLVDRVATVRPDLLELADALQHAPEIELASVALLHELLSNGCSPLYNPNLATAELQATLTRVRAGIWTGAR
jgi:hypothetical protein